MTDERPRHQEITFEETDIHARPVFWFTTALVVMVAVVALGVLFLERYLHGVALEQDRQEARAVSADRPVEAEAIASSFPEPRLQVDAYGDLGRFRAEEKALLEQWTVIDPVRGIARIPVEEAMNLVAEHGVPVWVPTPRLPSGTREVRP